jgi:hypothetical protein
MNWDRVRTCVESQISYWRAVRRLDWVEALELCLAKAERCQAMQDAVVDLRLRLDQAEAEKETDG